MECPHCNIWMSTSYGSDQHKVIQDHPRDLTFDTLLKQAERAGRPRCYSCRRMVESNTGSQHIRCKCKAEFWYSCQSTLRNRWLINSSYACGARWRTCECTEADQTRREDEIAKRLARFNAEVQAEEVDAGEAIAAVKRAERETAAERSAQERKNQAGQTTKLGELTKMEYARVEGIHNYFELMRATLEKVIRQQKQEITSRHELEIPQLEQELTDLTKANVSTERSRQISVERAKLIASNERKIVELRRQHLTALMHALQRHRDDQDAVFLQPIRGPETNRGLITQGVLETLVQAQEAERETMRAQQEREMAKWCDRNARALDEFDAIMREEQARFDKMHAVRIDGIRRALTMAREGAASDWKWFDRLVHARDVMIDEDERRMVLSGSHAPVLPARLDT